MANNGIFPEHTLPQQKQYQSNLLMAAAVAHHKRAA
jgi:hypothetical protein